jgi:glutamyl-tRNA synthetase
LTDAPRVRFAPAPTGYLHVGGARTALFNWFVARRTGGTFVLRIEDTDVERSRQELVDVVLRTLDWLGIDFDEGPHRQSERLEYYDLAVAKLLAEGRAYYCDCTRDALDARREARGDKTPGYDGHCRDRQLPKSADTAVRFRTPDEGTVAFDDAVRGRVVFEASALVDFVIQRADATPTFLVANAVDDAEMRITHAIRGEDLLNTVPSVLLLMDALGYEHRPAYAHLPLLVDEKRQKLSKRRHSVAVEDYRDRGYLPEAFVNFLSLLGWGPPDGEEIRPLERTVEEFRLEDVTKSGAFFDVAKLDHVNGEYLRRLAVDDFLERTTPFFQARAWPPGTPGWEAYEALAPLVQERAVTLADAPDMVDFVFLEAPQFDETAWRKVMGTDTAGDLLAAAIAAFETCAWDAQTLHATLGEIGERFGLKLGKAQAPVRVAVTGRSVGPPLFESLEVLGRERTLERMRVVAARLPSPEPPSPGDR